ncbi:unnamed protein product [Protopolystoma xenopodis]|uniref:Uncharacterized protein n=1 Tax=Protopolystoma xenopodis TaxID=117903 RepID=A0A3S5CE79_9PLAT|nr:unnamed protein product [Protopolystoma xenopodis]
MVSGSDYVRHRMVERSIWSHRGLKTVSRAYSSEYNDFEANGHFGMPRPGTKWIARSLDCCGQEFSQHKDSSTFSLVQCNMDNDSSCGDEHEDKLQEISCPNIVIYAPDDECSPNRGPNGAKERQTDSHGISPIPAQPPEIIFGSTATQSQIFAPTTMKKKQKRKYYDFCSTESIECPRNHINTLLECFEEDQIPTRLSSIGLQSPLIKNEICPRLQNVDSKCTYAWKGRLSPNSKIYDYLAEIWRDNLANVLGW